MKKLIAFDQDDTLNITKLPIDVEMAALLQQLLDKFLVCIISGTSWEVMKKNDIEPIKALYPVSNFNNLYILPTTGMQFWHYVGEKNSLDKEKIFDEGWKREYAHFLSSEQVKTVTQTLEKVAKQLGYWSDESAGKIIENRNSQITYSALGQWAAPEAKHAWDPDMKKRQAIVKLAEPELSKLGLKIAIGGSTSIDVTLPGIDKAYGMQQLMQQTGLEKKDILFIGDKLQVCGNDYPVKELGIDTIEVRNCEDTKWILKGIVSALN